MSDSIARLKKLLIVAAEYYQQHLTQSVLEIYVKMLSTVPVDAVEIALESIMKDPQRLRLPTAAVILEQIIPTQTCEQAAHELVTRTIEAIHRYGHYQVEDARIFLGEVVWSALPGAVGWEEFLEATNVTAARAQLRDRITTKLRQQFPNGRVTLSPPGKPEFRTLVPMAGNVIIEFPTTKPLTKLGDAIPVSASGHERNKLSDTLRLITGTKEKA